MSHSLETFYRVYDDKEGVFIELRPHPDLPDSAMELHSCSSSASQKFYGAFSVSLTPAQARLIAKALIDLADLIEVRP